MKISALSATVVIAFSSTGFAETMPSQALLLLDNDGNNVISFAEFSGHMDTLFGGMDTDQNNRIEREEVESFMSDKVFDAADTNQNGSISKAEYDIQVRKDFEDADRNGSGLLD